MDNLSWRNVVRGVFFLLIAGTLVIGLIIGSGFSTASDSSTDEGRFALSGEGSGEFDGKQVTVITGDSSVPEDREGPKLVAEILVIDRRGNLIYRNTTYDKYWDVDPVKGTQYTVLYAASMRLDSCQTDLLCYRNAVVEHNLSTDEANVLVSRVQTGDAGLRPHDIDRYENGDLIVADIASDRVYRVDPSSGMTRWSWDAQADFNISSGGPFPDDWTHLNDVEIVRGGQVMVSLRNQDQVVFLSPEDGVVDNLTLGSDDNYQTLYEQHNPDYIPRDRGGPAVLVADSENHRIVEYQRTNGTWSQSWVWSDNRMLWPRDADRLPNGNTLVTDSNGNRVFEISQNGEVVWSYDVAFPYEAERLGTGDESTGGMAASTLELRSRGDGVQTPSGTDSDEKPSFSLGILNLIKSVLPGPLVSAIQYLLPAWITPAQLLLFTTAGVMTGILGILEYRWRDYKISIQSPFRVNK